MSSRSSQLRRVCRQVKRSSSFQIRELPPNPDTLRLYVLHFLTEAFTFLRRLHLSFLAHRNVLNMILGSWAEVLNNEMVPATIAEWWSRCWSAWC